ncbi:MAG: zinc ribbon domain-containing protein [Candidatus Hydrogenedentes bacterium]|nr:zinc ribbon domain-containing protein [Candidatus Hydrogenedentota bacterium]
MPLFYYECKDCKQVSEILVKSAEEKVACPNCSSEKMEKLLSHFAPPGTSNKKRKFVGCIEDPGSPCNPVKSGGCGCSWCNNFAN